MAILYSALPQDPKRDVIVLDGKWAELYLIKAYALVELGRLSDGRAPLENAVALSPMNARVVSAGTAIYRRAREAETDSVSLPQSTQPRALPAFARTGNRLQPTAKPSANADRSWPSC